MKIFTRAESYSKYFELKNGINSSSFLNDERPEELYKFVIEVHNLEEFNECIENDWIYKILHEAFYELEEGYDSFKDVETCFEADMSTYERIEWLHETYAHGFIADSQVGLFGLSYAIDDQIVRGQCLAKKHIFKQVWAFLENNRDGEA